MQTGARRPKMTIVQRRIPGSEHRANVRNHVSPAVKQSHLATNGSIVVVLVGMGGEGRREGRGVELFDELVALVVDLQQQIKL